MVSLGSTQHANRNNKDFLNTSYYAKHKSPLLQEQESSTISEAYQQILNLKNSLDQVSLGD